MENQKLTNEELQTLQALNAEFNKMKMLLGDMEMQKHSVLQSVNDIRNKFGQHERLLIEKYGADAVINMQTGEVSQKPQANPLSVSKK
jgi:hypothetical protein